MKLGEIYNDQHISDSACKPPRIREDDKGYFWYQGETIELVWDITGDVLNDATGETISVEDFLQGKTALVRMYNFLGKKVASWEQAAANPIRIAIDNELAEKLLTGMYSFSITLQNNLGMVCELVSRSECEIEIR